MRKKFHSKGKRGHGRRGGAGKHLSSKYTMRRGGTKF